MQSIHRKQGQRSDGSNNGFTVCPRCGYKDTRSGTNRPNAQPSMPLDMTNLKTALQELQGNVQKLAARSEDKTYGAVKAIFFNWKDSNLNPTTYDETIKLQSLLREQFQFDAGTEQDIFRIPNAYPLEKLKKFVSGALADFCDVDAGGKKKLFIVYYTGHGGISNDRSLVLGGNSKETVAWEKIHELLLDSTQFDILLLMDCCFAARAIKAISLTRSVEILCASSREITSAMYKDGSWFTTALMKHLQIISNDMPEGCSTSELATKLHLEPGLAEQSPQHVILQGHTQKIILRPQKQTVATTAAFEVEVVEKDPETLEVLDNEEVEELTSGLPQSLSPTISLTGPSGIVHSLKCIFDTGSPSDFISAKAAARIGLTADSSRRGGEIVGFGGQRYLCHPTSAVEMSFGPGQPSHRQSLSVVDSLVFPPFMGSDGAQDGEVDVILGNKTIMDRGFLEGFMQDLQQQLDSASQTSTQIPDQDQLDRLTEQVLQLSQMITGALAARD